MTIASLQSKRRSKTLLTYRLLYNRNLYLRAYGRIYSNQGAFVISFPHEQAQRYENYRRNNSAPTPKWSDSFLPSWMLLITAREPTAQSALRAMWSMLLRPWKDSAEVAIVMLAEKAS